MCIKIFVIDLYIFISLCCVMYGLPMWSLSSVLSPVSSSLWCPQCHLPSVVSSVRSPHTCGLSCGVLCVVSPFGVNSVVSPDLKAGSGKTPIVSQPLPLAVCGIGPKLCDPRPCHGDTRMLQLSLL